MASLRILELIYMSSCSQRIVLSISVLLGLGVAVMTDEQDDRAKLAKSADEAPDYDAIIERLANSNREPKIVDVGNGQLPLFPKDYDWTEYERVVTIRWQLFKNEDPRLWEHFLKHFDDERYALTVGNDDPGNSRNCSVGDLCRDAALARLDFAAVHLRVENGEPFDLLRLDLGNANLRKWRNDRSKKSLYELQIEVCEQALEKITSEKDLSEEARLRIERELRAKIDRLKKTKKPLFFKVDVEEYGLFNAKLAEQARKQIEREAKRTKSQAEKVKKPR